MRGGPTALAITATLADWLIPAERFACGGFAAQTRLRFQFRRFVRADG
jgi:hypothetical protein